MVSIESTMEKIARVYGKSTGIKLVQGSGFATNCTDTIYYVPINDQMNKDLREESEVSIYHEIGHILETDSTKTCPNPTLHNIENAIEDTRIEKLGQRQWPGQKSKYIRSLTRLVSRMVNPRFQDAQTSSFKKLLDLIYLRVSERRLKTNFGIAVPTLIEKLYKEKCLPFETRVLNAETQDEIITIAKEMLEKFKDLTPPQPPKPPRRKGGKNEPQHGSDDADSGDQPESEPEDSGDQPESDSDSGSDESGDGSSDGDGADGEPESGSDDDQPGTGPVDSDDESNGGGSDMDEARKDLKKEIDTGKSDKSSSLSEDRTAELNKAVQSTAIYREAPGLKDPIVEASPNSLTDFKDLEKNGKAMTGYCGGKLRTLFITEHSQRWYRNQKTGRLDLRKVWNDHSDDVYRRKSAYTRDDAAVSIVVDGTGSMGCGLASKHGITCALMTALSTELEHLRIPVEVTGFSYVSNNNPYGHQGIRSGEAHINVIKRFEEPLRRVQERFTWSAENGTFELPSIRYAAQRLAARREPKKVLFIMSDGATGVGSIPDNTVKLAIKQYVQRVIKAGIHVVGFGIQSSAISYYCPDWILVEDLKVFANEFFSKLMGFLLKGGY